MPRSDDITRLALKVDIDTRIGLTEGARNLAGLLAELGVRATFYICMGPDHSGRALKRIFRPGFLKKQLGSGAAGAYGLRTMLYGLVLPGPIIASAAPTVFHRLLAEGHELGLHGWDHVYWHDYMRKLPAEDVARELARAAALFRTITGMHPASFASPGWQVSEPALEIMEAMGLSHVACGRGEGPFRPVVGGAHPEAHRISHHHGLQR